MNGSEQTAIYWTSLRAWKGSSKRAFQAWCREWIRNEVVPDGAKWVQAADTDQEEFLHLTLENRDEWHWLMCKDVAYFGMAESRALTKRVMQYIADHPKIIRLTFALPYPFAKRVSMGGAEEQGEWQAFMLRCAHLTKAQGKLVLFFYWDLSAWQEQWIRKKKEGTLALWFSVETLSLEWLKEQTQSVVADLQIERLQSHKKGSPSFSSLDAWLREPSYYQKVSHLRRKLQRYLHLLHSYPLSNVESFQEDLMMVIEELWVQPMFQLSFWSNQRMTMCLNRLHDQLDSGLAQVENDHSGSAKEMNKSLLHWMRLVREVEQFVEQPHWRVFHMPYMFTTASILDEKNGFYDMIRRGLNGKNPFLLLKDEDILVESTDHGTIKLNKFSCPDTVLWESLQTLGDDLRMPIFLVVINKTKRSPNEWQSWTSLLMTEWMRYPRLSCWIHRV